MIVLIRKLEISHIKLIYNVIKKVFSLINSLEKLAKR